MEGNSNMCAIRTAAVTEIMDRRTATVNNGKMYDIRFSFLQWPLITPIPIYFCVAMHLSDNGVEQQLQM